MDDLTNEVIPALLLQLNGVIERDCTEPPGPENPCGCTAEMARSLVSAFDGAAPDCYISAGDLEASSVGSLLGPDVDLFDEDGVGDPLQDGVLDSLSVGLRFSATGAGFPPLTLPDSPCD